MAGSALAIRMDLYTPADLRRLARRERERRAALRMLALATALERSFPLSWTPHPRNPGPGRRRHTVATG